MSASKKQQFDLGSVFPSKGDPRRPPEWFGRALLYTAIAVFLAWFAYASWSKVEFVVLDVVIATFVSLALEPLVVLLVKHGWKRGAASGATLIGLVVVVIALMGLFGNMFVQQVIGMVRGAPAFYEQVAGLVKAKTHQELPAMQDLGGQIAGNIQSSWVTDFAGQAYSTTVGLLGSVLNIMTVLLVTYYISAAGPKLRRSLCQWMSPSSQRRFVSVWAIAQDQISSFLFSRTILALISATCMSVFLVALKVPYWLPLALFCGLVSQFVPTIGTYIGGALPVVVAWGGNGLVIALAVLIYICLYQQVENLLLAPKISQRTMDLNAAIAFLSVLALGAVFGALGAFLALPVAASFQIIFKASTKRYDLIDSPLMNDPRPTKKSKVVEGAEVINEHVIKPMADHIPRQARGSSKRVAPTDGYTERAKDELSHMPTSEALDSSQTVAIPKHLVSAASGKPTLEPSGDSGRKEDGAERGGPGESAANPRKEWR
ncbi:putative permease [Bifidobacterium actinocoloniiforme DSM 22766]|uniref:Putative permease n=1 Tax=Bifidobacterium actinocoloniiforme DSM 22766 TaxID=1437605 RepID=A0A086Z1P3_9BIFI|nr:AI-2E family transporter [Bifidobacterium actinocoloniiforme]KFI40443.1 putative permease [Bifidobacterium actinocoloniiforme DSM 22766]